MKKLASGCILLLAISGFSQSQTITVTSPNGGENWALGSTHSITWTSSGLTGGVNILLFNGMQSVGVIKNDVPAAAGSFSWVVGNYQGGTAAPGTNYKVRVRKPQTEILDSSNRPFTISGAPPSASLSVTSPNGGETWQTNVACEVRWTSSGISGSVTVKLKKSNAVVKSWTAENTGSSYWLCSGVQAGNDYKIRVENSTGSVFDESDRNFTIQMPHGPSPPPVAGSKRTELAQLAQVEGTVRIPPRITSFSLNNGAEVVDDLLVTFNFQSMGGATHYRYRINPEWQGWEPVVSGRQPSGYLLLSACEQTVYFQVKNDNGESNVVSDSIKTSTFRTTRTIRIIEALRYARPQGFTSGVIWDDCDACATTIEFPDGSYQFYLGYPKDPNRNLTAGMKANYELFGGGRLLKPGWEFVSFGMPELGQVGNPDLPDAQGKRILYQPASGGRDIKLQVHLWRNILSDAVQFNVMTITLKGPCTEDISEAFKQQ